MLEISFFNEENMLNESDGLVPLIGRCLCLRQQTMGFALGVILLVSNFHFDLDRIAREDRGRIANFIVAIRHDVRIFR